MASDESYDGYDYHHHDQFPLAQSLSRLSVCGSSFNDEDNDCEESDDQWTLLTSESDVESECYSYSLPASPPRRRRGTDRGSKDYVVAEEPARSSGRWMAGRDGDCSNGGGVMVITRPKGGRTSLCMDLEEVKACRELGFELEHEGMLEVQSRLSESGSNGGGGGKKSLIADWRISSPGDDPRDVKARLKVWAQAVALLSASRTTRSL